MGIDPPTFHWIFLSHNRDGFPHITGIDYDSERSKRNSLKSYSPFDYDISARESGWDGLDSEGFTLNNQLCTSLKSCFHLMHEREANATPYRVAFI